MEKTTQIYIAGTTFLCTETAFERLNHYLKELRAHFATEDDGVEVIKDIESRIAEKLLEQKMTLITLTEIESVITDIGDVTTLKGESVTEFDEPKGYRKLYRDTHNRLIAGVAAGLAAYLKVDPIFIRLLFVGSIFFGGTGILAYLLLWLIIPEAKTATQRLEMRGEPITFSNIKDTIRHGRDIDRGGIRRSIGLTRDMAATVVRTIGKLFGAFLAIGAAFDLIDSFRHGRRAASRFSSQTDHRPGYALDLK